MIKKDVFRSPFPGSAVIFTVLILFNSGAFAGARPLHFEVPESFKTAITIDTEQLEDKDYPCLLE